MDIGDVSKIDWNKNNQVLSRELGVSVTVIANARRNHKAQYPTVGSYDTKVTTEMIESAEWEWEKDISLARKWRCTRERVRQIRNQYQKPACKVAGLSEIPGKIVRYILEHKDLFVGKAQAEAYDLLPEKAWGFSRQQAYLAMSRAGIDLKLVHKRRYSTFDYRKVDWSLPNNVLSIIWGLKQYSFAVQRNQYPHDRKKKWWMGGFSAEIFSVEFLSSARAELNKAKAEGIDNTDQLEAWIKWKQTNARKNPSTLKQNDQTINIPGPIYKTIDS